MTTSFNIVDGLKRFRDQLEANRKRQTAVFVDTGTFGYIEPVGPDRFRRLLDLGLINPDGTMTEAGRTAAVEAGRTGRIGDGD